MKHLNPRQGITITLTFIRRSAMAVPYGVKHLNPRQGITMNESSSPRSCSITQCVKHLNPRQGITMIRELRPIRRICYRYGVKHLNPRQGITIHGPMIHISSPTWPLCETPKSPPGDYNAGITERSTQIMRRCGVKHLNPRQGITIRSP